MNEVWLREDVRIVDAAPSDLGAIRGILNQAVRETTAVFHESERSEAEMSDWFGLRIAEGFPVLVAKGGDGAVLGYASYGSFRPFAGFAGTGEHSVYVAPGAQGRGVGRRLLDALIVRARADGLHVLVGGLEAGNVASLALHERAGFVETGRMPEVGRKFGRWLTLVFVQKVLDERPTP